MANIFMEFFSFASKQDFCFIISARAAFVNRPAPGASAQSA